MKQYPQLKEECFAIKCTDCIRQNIRIFREDNNCIAYFCVFKCNMEWKNEKGNRRVVTS